VKILINTVNMDLRGGVASYYNAIRDKFTEDVEYFIVGSRTNNDSVCHTVIRFVSDIWKFYQRLKKGNYDIIHLNPSLDLKAILRDAIFLLIAKRFEVKVIVQLMGWTESFARTIENYFAQLFGCIYFKADVFVVLSSEFRDRLFRMGYRKKIYTETTAVDDDFVSGFDIDSIVEKTEKIETNLSILFLARIEKAKGIYQAIDTYKILSNKFQFINMTIAGDGSELVRAQDYVRRNKIGGIQFVGYVRDQLKKQAFLSSDVYLFPTYYGEGMPASVLEAMAFGLPVVTRTVGGLRDFFENGKMGFITTSKDPSVLADLVEKLILDEHLRHEITLYNFKYAKSRFMASSVAKRLEDIYLEL